MLLQLWESIEFLQFNFLFSNAFMSAPAVLGTLCFLSFNFLQSNAFVNAHATLENH